MINEIKRIFPIAAIIWTPEDVIEYGLNMKPPAKVSQEIAEGVISDMENNADCGDGLTWDTIDLYLNFALDEEYEEDLICDVCNGSGEGKEEGTVCPHCKGVNVKEEV